MFISNNLGTIFKGRAFKTLLCMVLYLVNWTAESELTQGKGKVKNREGVIGFTVLCRNCHDAVSCLYWYFDHEYKNSNNLSVDDGVVRLTRCKIDSRGFTANYMMMDGIREPIELADLKSNILRIHKIFNIR